MQRGTVFTMFGATLILGTLGCGKAAPTTAPSSQGDQQQPGYSVQAGMGMPMAPSASAAPGPQRRGSMPSMSARPRVYVYGGVPSMPSGTRPQLYGGVPSMPSGPRPLLYGGVPSMPSGPRPLIYGGIPQTPTTTPRVQVPDPGISDTQGASEPATQPPATQQVDRAKLDDDIRTIRRRLMMMDLLRRKVTEFEQKVAQGSESERAFNESMLKYYREREKEIYQQ